MENKKIFGLGKHLKALLDLINPKDTRPHFQGLVVRKTGIAEVTDSHILLRVPLNEVDADELPTTLGVDAMTTDAWISLPTLKNAFKSLNGKTSLDFLKNLFIRNGKDLALVSTDLTSVSESREPLETSKYNLENFAVTGKVLRLDKTQVKFSINFMKKKKKKLAVALDGMAEGKGNVTLLFTGEHSIVHVLFPVGADKQGIGAFMPVKSEHDGETLVKIYNRVMAESEGKAEETQEAKETVAEKEQELVTI